MKRTLSLLLLLGASLAAAQTTNGRTSGLSTLDLKRIRATKLRFVVPTMAGVQFEGAGSGEVVMADGKRAALPAVRGHPTFMPASFPGARTLVLARTPSRLLIGPAPKAKKG